MTTTGFIWGIIAFIIGFASGYYLRGKKNVQVLLILLFISPVFSRAQTVLTRRMLDSLPRYTDTIWIAGKHYKLADDTIKCVMLITDMQIINGVWDNRPYSLKGFKVLADYETYYLDISKQRLPKNIIVWLDQNE